MTQSEIIQALRDRDPEIVAGFYKENREPFISFLMKLKVSRNEAVDVYQESFMVLMEKASQRKLDGINATVTTYLFSIGKYMVYARNRKNAKKVQHNDEIFELDREMEHNLTNSELDVRSHAVKIAFQEMSSTCTQILRLFYYEGLTISEICDYLQYKDKTVVKSQKSRCLRTLRKMIKTDRP